jgi:hypothetical protein
MKLACELYRTLTLTYGFCGGFRGVDICGEGVVGGLPGGILVGDEVAGCEEVEIVHGVFCFGKDGMEWDWSDWIGKIFRYGFVATASWVLPSYTNSIIYQST